MNYHDSLISLWYIVIMYVTQIKEWLSINKLKIEGVLAALCIAALLSKYSGLDGADQAVMLSLSTLAVFYFLSSNFTPELTLTGYFGTIATKLVGVTSAVIVVGILFSVLKLNGHEEMLRIAGSSIAVAGLAVTVYCIFFWNQNLIPIILRLAILGTICGAMLLGFD